MIAGASLALSPSAVGQTLIGLAPLGGPYSQGLGLNEQGQVAGGSSIDNNGSGRPTLFSNGVTTVLGTLGQPYGSASDINNLGQMTGSVSGNGNSYGFIYSNGVMTNLGSLGVSDLGFTTTQGAAINDSGWVTGLSYDNQSLRRAFLYYNGVMQVLSLGGNDSFGADINASGQVTGSSEYYPGSKLHAFLYTNGVMQDLGAPGGGGTRGLGLNNLGEVVGSHDAANLSYSHAFLYSQGVMTDLGTLGVGISSQANDLNDLGQVVGDSSFTSDVFLRHAFLYSGGVMNDLNTLYSGLLGDGVHPGFLYLAAANDINDRGQITGWGMYFDGRKTVERGFLLNTLPASPFPTVPEETTTLGLLLFAALAGFGAHALRLRSSPSAKI